MIWTLSFWKGAGERAFATFWQTFAALLSVMVGDAVIPQVGLESITWVTILSASGVAAVLSLAKSLATPEFTAGAEPRRAVEPTTRIVFHGDPENPARYDD